MNPKTPTNPGSAMLQGGTFMRPGAVAWGYPGQPGTPQPDQQDADGPVGDRVRHDRFRGRGRIALAGPPQRRERRMALGHRPVRSGERDRRARRIARYGPSTVTVSERDDPGH